MVWPSDKQADALAIHFSENLMKASNLSSHHQALRERASAEIFNMRAI